MWLTWPISSQIVPSRSRKTARRRAPASDTGGAPATRLGEPRARRRINGVHGDARHTAMVYRTLSEKTRTAGNRLAHQGEMRRYRLCAPGVGGAKDAHDRQARRGGHMHCAGVVPDEQMARME